MPLYRYQALDESLRETAGELDAESVSAAISALELRGLAVQSIARASESMSEGSLNSQAKSATKASLISPLPESLANAGKIELRSLLTQALKQGPAIAPILRAYSQELSNGTQRQDLQEVARALETGSVDQALRSFSDQAQWWLPFLGAIRGPTTPGAALQRFVLRVGPAHDRLHQWWLALAYPLTLIAVVLGVLVTMGLLIVPTFRSTYFAYGTQLPASTILLLAFSDWLRTRWALLALGFVILGLATVMLVTLRPVTGRRILNRVLARLPRWATPRRMRALWISRFAAFVADSLDAGTTIPVALRLAALASQRPSLQASACQLAHEIEHDLPTHNLAQRRALSATMIYAVSMPIPLSERVQLLRELSHCQLEQSINRGGFSAAIGPITVVAVGLLVGWFALALFLPLFNLISALT